MAIERATSIYRVNPREILGWPSSYPLIALAYALPYVKLLSIACCLAGLSSTPSSSIRNRIVFFNSSFSPWMTYSSYTLPKARMLCASLLHPDSNTTFSLLKTSIPWWITARFRSRAKINFRCASCRMHRLSTATASNITLASDWRSGPELLIFLLLLACD